MKIDNPVIPLGSTVVVIGANGYLGVETCEKFLEAGYRVLGTVRDVEQHRSWMGALFDTQWPGMFELVRVEDFEAEGAFDQAFEGAAAVVYVSTPIVFSADPAQAVDPIIRGTINTLEAALRASATVKRYVLSGSSKAVTTAVYGGEAKELTESTFNREEVTKMRASSEKGDALGVFSAGRTLAELAFWDWVREKKPPFVANCVVPDGNFGRVRDVQHIKSTVGMLKRVLSGEWDTVFMSHLGYYVDGQDTARLLVAAATLESVSGERVFAYRHQASWDDLRERSRQLLRTGKAKVRDGPARVDEIVRGKDLGLPGRDMTSASGVIARAEEILRMVGQPGFATEDEILGDFLASMY